MGMNMTEKILAAHAGLKKVSAGQLITCKLDMVLANEQELREAGLQSMTEVKFENSISRATNNIDHVQYRFNTVLEIIESAIKETNI